jgi:hypothetical protein
MSNTIRKMTSFDSESVIGEARGETVAVEKFTDQPRLFGDEVPEEPEVIAKRLFSVPEGLAPSESMRHRYAYATLVRERIRETLGDVTTSAEIAPPGSTTDTADAAIGLSAQVVDDTLYLKFRRKSERNLWEACRTARYAPDHDIPSDEDWSVGVDLIQTIRGFITDVRAKSDEDPLHDI